MCCRFVKGAFCEHQRTSDLYRVKVAFSYNWDEKRRSGGVDVGGGNARNGRKFLESSLTGVDMVCGVWLDNDMTQNEINQINEGDTLAWPTWTGEEATMKAMIISRFPNGNVYRISDPYARQWFESTACFDITHAMRKVRVVK